MLKISRGVEHDPEAEPHGDSYRDFDLKNPFSFGNVPTATFFQKYKRKSIFSVEVFVSSSILLGL